MFFNFEDKDVSGLKIKLWRYEEKNMSQIVAAHMDRIGSVLLNTFHIFCTFEFRSDVNSFVQGNSWLRSNV